MQRRELYVVMLVLTMSTWQTTPNYYLSMPVPKVYKQKLGGCWKVKHVTITGAERLKVY